MTTTTSQEAMSNSASNFNCSETVAKEDSEGNENKEKEEVEVLGVNHLTSATAIDNIRTAL